MTNPEIAFTNEGYTAWIESLSTRYRESQIKAAVSVNAEMLKFYFGLGRDIVMMGKDQPWGSGFLKRVSVDLKTKMPDADCFSQTNLGYMRRFFELYAHVIYPQLGGEIERREISNLEKPIYPQVGDELDTSIFQVPWGHHKCLIDKFLHEPDKALFYVRETVKVLSKNNFYTSTDLPWYNSMTWQPYIITNRNSIS